MDSVIERTEKSAEAVAARPDLFLSDARVAYLLIDDARRRALTRVFGVSREDANLLTLVVTVLLAQAAHDKITKLLRAPGMPSTGDGVLMFAAARELLQAAAGPSVRETQPPWTLITLTVLALSTRRGVRRSAKWLRSFSHDTAVSFHGRYGYLVDPGHHRARHAQVRNNR